MGSVTKLADFTAADLDLQVSPGDDDLTFDWSDDSDQSGTWLFVVRDELDADTTVMTATVDTTDAATGTIVVPLDEDDLADLIPSGSQRYVGVYGLSKDTVEIIAGRFIVVQKVTRTDPA
jgi:hypothetical protein